MASNGNGLSLPTLTRDKIRLFLRWLNTSQHSTCPMVYERKDVDDLSEYVTRVLRSILDEVGVNRFGVVTPDAIEAAFVMWCTKQSSRLKALELFNETKTNDDEKEKKKQKQV